MEVYPVALRYRNKNHMRTVNILSIAAGLLCVISCSKYGVVKVEDPIMISSPTPTEQISKITLDETQSGYVKAGNDMSFRFLDKLYDGDNLVCSPLSLQYAMSMAANGAEGETLNEIVSFLGYEDNGIDALNEYNRLLLEQLPAVDLDVRLKVTDALLVNDELPLKSSFKKTLEDYYYAAADNMDFSDPRQVAARINEWADRSTDGFINKILDPSDISEYAVAYIMNALYFKAKWARDDDAPMFRDYNTKKEDFTLSNGKTVQVDMMRNSGNHYYAQMDGYQVLALPYANYKFYMYILLPDDNDVEGLVSRLPSISWNEILSSLTGGTKVNLKLPKFNIENKYILNDVLNDLGVEKAFKSGQAEFDRMFDADESWRFWIEKVIQKSRISVTEWGTEAGSVTIVEMDGFASAGPSKKPIDFFVDHPFIFIIGEKTSGTILFEGVVNRP